MCKEVWKDIVGYENSYLISNTGKVRSINKQYPCKDYEMMIQDNGKGYKLVSLCLPNKKK